MNTRNATLAKIHIAKKDLALDDDVYREILWTVARVRSARDLDAHGRERIIPMAAATGLPSFEVDARTARRIAHGIQLGRHDVRGGPVEGMLQLVHRGRLVALAECHKGLPQLRTLRVFLEGTKG